jgi:hypothetical protein
MLYLLDIHAQITDRSKHPFPVGHACTVGYAAHFVRISLMLACFWFSVEYKHLWWLLRCSLCQHYQAG